MMTPVQALHTALQETLKRGEKMEEIDFPRMIHSARMAYAELLAVVATVEHFKLKRDEVFAVFQKASRDAMDKWDTEISETVEEFQKTKGKSASKEERFSF